MLTDVSGRAIGVRARYAEPVPPRERMPSYEDLNKVAERIEEAVERGTGSGVARKMNSIRVRELLEGALDKREKSVLERQIEGQRGLTRHILGVVIAGIILMICTAVVGYATGRAAAPPPPAGIPGHP